MNRAWRPIVQRLVWSLLIVEPQPAADTLTGFGHRTIRFDIHLLVFQAAPQPLDKNVVQKSPFAVHADPHALARKPVQERGAGKPHALIGVENFRTAVPVRGPSTAPGGKGQYADVAIHAGLVCLNGPTAMDLDMQLELFDQAMDELAAEGDVVNQVLEVTMEDDTIHIRRYRLPAVDL